MGELPGGDVEGGADIDEKNEALILRTPAPGRDQSGQSGPRCSGDHGDVACGAQHQRAGASCADQCVGFFPSEHLGPDEHGGAPLPENGFLGGLVHRDSLVRVNDLDPAPRIVTAGEEGRDPFLISDENTAKPVFLGERPGGPPDHRFGSVIAPHGVHRDACVVKGEGIHRMRMRSPGRTVNRPEAM